MTMKLVKPDIFYVEVVIVTYYLKDNPIIVYIYFYFLITSNIIL